MGLKADFPIDPFLPRVAVVGPGLAAILLLVFGFRTEADGLGSFLSILVMVSVDGTSPVVSLRKLRMLAGVIGAMSAPVGFGFDGVSLNVT